MDFRTFEQYSEQLWTVLVQASATELFKFEETENLNLSVYPLMKTCFVICDNHALQLLRKKFNIEREFEGEYPVKKSHYEFDLSMKMDQAYIRRNERLKAFFKGFSHFGIYNTKCWQTNSVEDFRMTYKLSLDAYDDRGNVLSYLLASLKNGFAKEDLLLEKTNY